MGANKRLIFVCTGNTCRSPMAQGLLQAAVGLNEDWKIQSAGIAASYGFSESLETAKVLEENQASLESFSSQPITEELVDWATHLIAFTRSHKDFLYSVFPQSEGKVYLLKQFVSQPKSIDISDPIGGGSSAYHQAAEEIKASLLGVLEL